MREGQSPDLAGALLGSLLGMLQGSAASPKAPPADTLPGDPRLRLAEAKYRTLLEQIPAVTFMASFGTGPGEIYVSPQIETLLGYTQKEWLDSPILWYQRLHPDDKERWNKEFARVVATGEEVESVYRFLARDGRVVWVHGNARIVRDEKGRPLFIQGVGFDITGVKQAEEEMRSREAEYRALVENIPGAVYRSEVDHPWRLLFVSDQIEAISGYPAREFIKGERGYMDIVLPEDIPHIDASIRAAIEERRPYEVDYRIRHRDGRIRWVSDRGTVTRNSLGRPAFYEGVVIDITARKEAEEELQRRTVELKTANRELDAFAYTVSHDLRAPLRTMHRFSDVLAEEYVGKPLDPEGLKYLQRISSGARQMDQLIQDLLAYSRLAREEIVLHAVSLQEVVKEVLGRLAGDIAHLKARIEVEPELPQILGERVLAGQVVANLLSNALRFVHDGRAPVVRVRSERRDRRVRLWIEDEGVGIAPEYHDRIFKIFERLNPQAYSGTGIGLAIVKKAMEQMGGSVGVVSALGAGSRFWVEFRAPEA
ncbi:MAG TPA: PAS domain-containing protein, partial [Planctomycetota bacterium]|nr:PAS domain-containing protein [Planctomycetota bacterium]